MRGGNRFNFRETNRDDWSVYLVDRSRDVRIQLDLHTKKVMYSDARSPRRPLYDIHRVSAGRVQAPPTPQPPPRVQPPAVNGRNVTRVFFGQGGNRLGRYVQTGAQQWQELPAVRGGNRFSFRETNRDDWSVYLFDRSRNVRIQLDLHTRKVMYSDARSPRRSLYEIQRVSAERVQAQPPPRVQPPAVNGRNVTRVVFGRGGTRLGRYVQTGARQWQEIPAARGGSRFSFRETNRDDWSVYLSDRSRKVRIQLDLHTKKVMYSDARSSRRSLYEIQRVSAERVQAQPPPRVRPRPPQPRAIKPAVNGRNVTRVVFGRGGNRLGRYVQTGARQWQEIPAARGGNRFSFRETNRDAWSVYLFDRSRKVRIQLDLHTKKVMYSDARSSRRSLYEIQRVSAERVQAQPSPRVRPRPPQPRKIKPVVVKGRNVTRVVFGRGGKRLGRYVQTGARRWQEIPAARGGSRFSFRETNRDEWSVYLFDRSRKVRIQLDLHTKKVMYSDARSSRRPLYDIQRVSAKGR